MNPTAAKAVTYDELQNCTQYELACEVLTLRDDIRRQNVEIGKMRKLIKAAKLVAKEFFK